MEHNPMRRIRAMVFLGLIMAGSAAAQSAEDEDIPYSRNGADSCLACHEEPSTLSVFHTKHAVPTDSRSCVT